MARRRARYQRTWTRTAGADPWPFRSVAFEPTNEQAHERLHTLERCCARSAGWPYRRPPRSSGGAVGDGGPIAALGAGGSGNGRPLAAVRLERSSGSGGSWQRGQVERRRSSGCARWRGGRRAIHAAQGVSPTRDWILPERASDCSRFPWGAVGSDLPPRPAPRVQLGAGSPVRTIRALIAAARTGASACAPCASAWRRCSTGRTCAGRTSWRVRTGGRSASGATST